MSLILGMVVEHFWGQLNVGSSSEYISLKYLLILYLPYWAFREEVIFRFLPFLFIFLFRHKISNGLFFLLLYFSSFLFGWLHGDFKAIFVHGVVGGYLCLIFWRYSLRLKNWRGLATGLIASTTVHFTFNAFSILVNYLLSKAS